MMILDNSTNEEGSSGSSGDTAILLAECKRLRAEGDAERALGLLDAAPNKDCIDLLALRAALLGDLGRLEESLAVLRHARCVDKTHHAARFGLCFTLYLLERWPEALAELDAFIVDAPNQANALWLRAGLLRRRLVRFFQRHMMEHKHAFVNAPVVLAPPALFNAAIKRPGYLLFYGKCDGLLPRQGQTHLPGGGKGVFVHR